MKVAFGASWLGSRPGLVVALPDEARALAGKRWRLEDGRPVCRSIFGENREMVWVRSGIGPARARDAARWLIRQNVTGLAIMGVSGGLAPGLEPGRLVVAESVLDGTQTGAATHPACPWCKELLEALRHNGLDPVSGPVITMAEPVLGPQDKRRLYDTTGALAVDMESAAVVRAAAEAGRNCLVLRAICDGPDRQVPSAMLRMIDEDGRLKIPVLLKELLRRPALIGELLIMRRDFARALEALKKAEIVMSNK